MKMLFHCYDISSLLFELKGYCVHQSKIRLEGEQIVQVDTIMALSVQLNVTLGMTGKARRRHDVNRQAIGQSLFLRVKV